MTDAVADRTYLEEFPPPDPDWLTERVAFDDDIKQGMFDRANSLAVTAEREGAPISEFAPALLGTSLRAWALENVHTEEGSVLTWVGQPWMAQIWDDTTRQIAIQKCTQIGATVLGYSRAFHNTVMLGETGIYTMPTASDVNDFVSGRLDRVIDNSPRLAALLNRTGPLYSRTGVKKATPRDNSRVKHMGEGTLYLRGTQSMRQAVSVPCRFLIHDELDLSMPEVLEMYQHRLDRLPPDEWKILYISTPTQPGFGVNQRYQLSNAYTWLVKCSRCNMWQSLSYWENTKGTATFLMCRRCDKPLDPSDDKMCEWVDERPSLRGIRNGYKLSRLMLCTPDPVGAALLSKLHERRIQARFMRHFVNMDLGETSSEGSVAITHEQLLGAAFNNLAYPYPDADFQRRAEPFSGPYYMGIDQGDTLTITVGRDDPRLDNGRIRLVFCYRYRDPDRGSEGWAFAARLMEDYQIRMCVVDGNPNSAPAHDLAKQFPGRVLVCYYKDGQKTQVQAARDVEKMAENTSYLSRPQVDNTTRVDITVERTEALDITAAQLTGGVFMFPGDATNLHPEVLELMRQVENNVRRPYENPKTHEVYYRWDRKGPNDYFHSLTYLRLAREEGVRLHGLGGAPAAPVGVWGVPTPQPKGSVGSGIAGLPPLPGIYPGLGGYNKPKKNRNRW